MENNSLHTIIEKLESLFSSFNSKFFNGELQKPIIRATKEVRVMCSECDVEFEEET